MVTLGAAGAPAVLASRDAVAPATDAWFVEARMRRRATPGNGERLTVTADPFAPGGRIDLLAQDAAFGA